MGALIFGWGSHAPNQILGAWERGLEYINQI